MILEAAKQNFHIFTVARMHVNLGKTLLVTNYIIYKLGTKIVLSKASSRTMENLSVRPMGSTTIPQDFDRDEFPKL